MVYFGSLVSLFDLQSYLAMNPNVNNTDQEDRAFLRRRFLQCLVAQRNEAAVFRMHNGLVVNAKFGTMDIDFLRIHVSALETPMGIVPEAIIRTRDIISFAFPSTP